MKKNRNIAFMAALPLAAPVYMALACPDECIAADLARGQEVKTEISLGDCQKMALENNPYILNAQLDIWAAQARKREAVAEYFPRVSVNALAFYAFDPILELGVKDIFGDNDFSNNLNNILTNLGGQMGFDPVYSTLKHGVSATVSAVQPVFAGGGKAETGDTAAYHLRRCGERLLAGSVTGGEDADARPAAGACRYSVQGCERGCLGRSRDGE